MWGLIMTEIDKILKLQKKLQELKESQIKLKSKYDFLLEQLKTDFDCNNLEEAQKKIKTLESELEDIQGALEKQLGEFEEKYPL